jgi:hypothetical protein
VLTLKLSDEVAEVDAVEKIRGRARDAGFVSHVYELMETVTLGQKDQNLGCINDLVVCGRALLANELPGLKSSCPYQ